MFLLFINQFCFVTPEHSLYFSFEILKSLCFVFSEFEYAKTHEIFSILFSSIDLCLNLNLDLSSLLSTIFSKVFFNAIQRFKIIEIIPLISIKCFPFIPEISSTTHIQNLIDYSNCFPFFSIF